MEFLFYRATIVVGQFSLYRISYNNFSDVWDTLLNGLSKAYIKYIRNSRSTAYDSSMDWDKWVTYIQFSIIHTAVNNLYCDDDSCFNERI